MKTDRLNIIATVHEICSSTHRQISCVSVCLSLLFLAYLMSFTSNFLMKSMAVSVKGFLFEKVK